MQHHTDLTSTTAQQDPACLQTLEFAMEAAGVGMWDISVTAPRTLTFDNRCRELFGFAGSNCIPYEEAFRFIHEEDRQAIQTGVQQALDPMGSGNFDITCRVSGDGNSPVQWVRLTGKSAFSASGAPQRFSGIAMDVTAEKLAREKALAAEKLTGILAKGTGVGLFHINLADDQVDYSPAFAIILTGENKENLTRRDFISHIHPDDMAARNAAYEVASKTGDLFYESRTVWTNGTVHMIRTVGTYGYDANGKPAFFSGTVQDITEQRQKEQALKAAEERFSHAIREREAMFRNITSTSPVGLWMSNEEGKLIYVNKTLTDWTGMPNETILGMGWTGAVVEEDRLKTTDLLQYALTRREHYDIEFRIRKGNGEVIWCRSAGDPYYRDDGSYAGFVGFCMDIHDLVVATDNLKMNEGRISEIVEQAPMAIGVLSSRQMVVETANAKILKLWGKDKTIIGMPIMQALPELKDQPFLSLLEHVFDTGEPHFGYNTPAELEHNDVMHKLYFDFVYTPVKDVHGRIDSIMVMATEVTAQVLARKALMESEARFRSLIQEAPVATCIFEGLDMNVQLANEKILALWGKGKEIIGKPLTEALPELVGQPFIKLLEDVYTTGIPYTARDAAADLVVNGKLSTYYFDFTYKPLFDSAGEIYGVLDMAVDVTEQVTARKKLEESELFARSVIQNSPVAKAVFTGPDMVIKTINENMLEMLGRDTSIIGMPLMKAIPELAQTQLANRLKHVITTGETFYQPEEKIMLIRFGKPYSGYYNYIYKALPNIAGEFYGVIVTATEVTDLVLTRQKIEEAEASLRGAIELAELGTWNIDLVTGTIDFSHRLRTWFGFDDDELITINKAYDALAAHDRHLIKKLMLNAINSEYTGVVDAEYLAVNKTTGRERIIHAQGKPFFNDKNEAYRISGTAQDVTEQRKLQLALEHEVKKRTEELEVVNATLKLTNDELFLSNERLVHSNQELEQYAYVTSHDLQEPLRKIRTFSGMLNNQKSLPEENRPLIGKIMQSAERMSMLIRDLLEFSRLLKTETLTRPIDLSEVCKSVINDFELSIQEKKATVDFDNLPVIEAVGLQMNQLFSNLLSNALKFSSTEVMPHIKITSHEIGFDTVKQYIQRPNKECTYHRITFSDNGIGFDVIYADQIFEVFKRLHGRNAYPGSGIGLALCRRIAENHNGHLYAESVVGQGSSFHIIIPQKTVLCD